jgi:hypothetical protein
MPSQTATADHAPHDFDFFMGEWRVHHRRLKRRLAGDTTWEEFAGTSSARKVLGGFGNIDDNEIDLPGGAYRAVTLRVFDPAKRLWSIYWLDSRIAAIDPPVIGRFADDVGTFYGDDVFEGKPIRVRFLWSDMTPTSCRWAQAFSADGGSTWETNWLMEFTRV